MLVTRLHLHLKRKETNAIVYFLLKFISVHDHRSYLSSFLSFFLYLQFYVFLCLFTKRQTIDRSVTVQQITKKKKKILCSSSLLVLKTTFICFHYVLRFVGIQLWQSTAENKSDAMFTIHHFFFLIYSMIIIFLVCLTFAVRIFSSPENPFHLNAFDLITQIE